MSAAVLATLSDISNEATYYFSVIVVPIGIVVNIFSSVVFLRKNIRSTNMAFYNQMISIVNTLTLLYYMLVYNSALVLGNNFFNVSDWLCKLLYFIRRVIRQIAPIIESVMTVDRLMTVYFPFKFKFIQKKKFILAFNAAILFVFAGLDYENLQFYLNITYKNSTVNGTRSQIVASKSCTASRFVQVQADLVATFLRIIIPFSVCISCNILIARKLKTKKAIRSNNKARKENNFTRNVMMLNFWFLILNMPEGILYVVKDVYSFFDPLTMPSGQIVTFCWNIVYLLTVLHYMINNLFNFKYNSLFRKEVC
jgi:hypothetical protein